jgi:alpha-tubulin suppressor-like RCC1 family protein
MGEVHTLVRTKSGKLYAFGHNYFGQVGSTLKVELYPYLVPISARVLQIAAGGFFSVVVLGEEVQELSKEKSGIKKLVKWITG